MFSKIVGVCFILAILIGTTFAGYGNLPKKGFNKWLKSKTEITKSVSLESTVSTTIEGYDYIMEQLIGEVF